MCLLFLDHHFFRLKKLCYCVRNVRFNWRRVRKSSGVLPSHTNVIYVHQLSWAFLDVSELNFTWLRDNLAPPASAFYYVTKCLFPVCQTCQKGWNVSLFSFGIICKTKLLRLCFFPFWSEKKSALYFLLGKNPALLFISFLKIKFEVRSRIILIFIWNVFNQNKSNKQMDPTHAT